MEDNEAKFLIGASFEKINGINNKQAKVASHWYKLRGLIEAKKYVDELANRMEQDTQRLENEAAKRIQKWWRTVTVNHHHRAKQKDCGKHLEVLKQSEISMQTLQFTDEEFSSQHMLMLDENKPSAINVAAANKANDQDQTFDESQEKAMTPKILGHAKISFEHEAASKIQAWWRGLSYRHKVMLPAHKEMLKIHMEELQNRPSSEANPKEERKEPLNQRIERYLNGLLSMSLTERKVMALRLNRLAGLSHVAIECMLNKCAFKFILDSLADTNRSEAHLYVIRPLCALTAKLLSYQPYVEPFAKEYLDQLIYTAVHMIHNNYKDPEVVIDQTSVLKQLSHYSGFKNEMKMVRFNWYMTKFKEQFVRYKNDDQHYMCYQELCKLQQILNSN